MNYLQTIAGAVRRQVEPELVPPDSDSLFVMYAVLVRSKGQSTTAEDVHDVWTAWMTSKGEVHDSMTQFDQLEPDVQSEDEPFLRAIRCVAGDQ